MRHLVTLLVSLVVLAPARSDGTTPESTNHEVEDHEVPEKVKNYFKGMSAPSLDEIPIKRDDNNGSLSSRALDSDRAAGHESRIIHIHHQHTPINCNSIKERPVDEIITSNFEPPSTSEAAHSNYYRHEDQVIQVVDQPPSKWVAPGNVVTPCGKEQQCPCINTCTADTSTCPIVAQKKFYVETKVKRNWYAAYMFCRSKGWRLATIMNKKENDDMLAQIRKSHRSTVNYHEGIWLGGLELGHLRKWQWMDTGRDLTFTDWLKGEPNHRPNEHCLDLWTLKWNDEACNLLQLFVCEYKTYKPSCIN